MKMNTTHTHGMRTAPMRTGTKTAAKINIGLAEDERQGVAEILTRVLADEYVLYTKTRHYHWNVVGPHFQTLHAFFEHQYEHLNETIDKMAERIRALDCPAMGTQTEFLELSRLEEHPGHYPAARDMVSNLLADHETLIQCLRDDLETCESTYHDSGTRDFLSQFMIAHEKMAWMLRAFLQGEPM